MDKHTPRKRKVGKMSQTLPRGGHLKAVKQTMSKKKALSAEI